MEPLREFLNAVRHRGAAHGNFLGLLHVLIGRRITRADGAVVSGGMTWRELALLFKQQRRDREAVRELNLDPAALPPRDRDAFGMRPSPTREWPARRRRRPATRLAAAVQPLGYVVGPAPGGP